MYVLPTLPAVELMVDKLNKEIEYSFQTKNAQLLAKFEKICDYYHESQSSKKAVTDIKSLLKNGLNPNAKTESNQPLLIRLLDSTIHHEQLLEAMTLLIKNNSCVNAENAQGDALLLYACCKCYSRKEYPAEIVKILIDHGADINVQQKRNGRTPLHIAVIKSNTQLFKTLWAKNPDLQQDIFGKDPFKLACECEALEILKIMQES